MYALIDILSWLCLLTGAIFSVLGGIGLVRFPDFYSRLHGGGITDTMGAGMIILGLLLQALRAGIAAEATTTPWLVAIKLLMVLFFLSITSPSSCHALAQAAWHDGLKPQLPAPPEAPSDD
ncbi:MAG: monovalent cation/H(+) antiporter subunit G [Planctomycetota bacterium]|nr:monovalent cation/H(+) antiporter subunit G [Planctomycetota bacterium]